MRPTRAAPLVALAVAAALAGWLLARTSYEHLPPLPRIGPMTLAVLAVVVVAMARGIRTRMRGGTGVRPVDPIGVARAAALARAGSAAGALFGGGYAGFGVWLLPSLEKAQPGRDALSCLVGVLAAAALVAASLHLERTCRVRRPPDEPPLGSPP